MHQVIPPALQPEATTVQLFSDRRLFARASVSVVHGAVGGTLRTSQWFRIAERPPTTDLRGGKASEDSFTRLMANLVVAYAVELQFNLPSDVAFGSTA